MNFPNKVNLGGAARQQRNVLRCRSPPRGDNREMYCVVAVAVAVAVALALALALDLAPTSQCSLQ